MYTPPSGANYPMLDPRFLAQQASARDLGSERSSLFASLVLAMALNASLFGKLFEGGLTGNLLQAASMSMLIVFSWFARKQFSVSAIPASFGAAFGSIFLVTALVGIFGYFVSAPGAGGLGFSGFLKAGGTILTLSALIKVAPVFTYKDLVRGLVIFSVIESIACIALFQAGTDINANALAVRLSVAALTLFTFSKPKYLKVASLSLCIIFSFALQCRTSLCAVLGALVFMYVEQRTRKSRALVLFIVVMSTCFLWLALPTIVATIKSVATANLGSDNFIATFFLADKSASKIDTDILDRGFVWEYSWEFISKRPWVGYGFGTENAIMGARSHNAYLSLLFEGGIFNLFAWGWFYYLSLARLFDQKLLKKTGDLPLFNLCNLLIGYMLLAGFVETSGLASVSTPINLIFILLTIWLFSPRPRVRNV